MERHAAWVAWLTVEKSLLKAGTRKSTATGDNHAIHDQHFGHMDFTTLAQYRRPSACKLRLAALENGHEKRHRARSLAAQDGFDFSMGNGKWVGTQHTTKNVGGATDDTA